MVDRVVSAALSDLRPTGRLDGAPGRVDPAAAGAGAQAPAGHAGYSAALASPADRWAVDRPEPARPPAGAGGGRRAGRTAGQGQRLPGLPAHPGRVGQARASGSRLDDPPDPETRPDPASADPPPEHRLAAVPAGAGVGGAGGRVLPRRDRHAAPALRSVRAGGGVPVRPRPGGVGSETLLWP